MPASDPSQASTPLMDGGHGDDSPALQHSHILEKTDSRSASPRPVQHDKVWRVCETLVDLVLMACCLAFLAFAVIVRAYDGTFVEDHKGLAEGMLTATSYGPTILPILFAAVVGRAGKACLSWRLEAGERLGTLDLLATSTSFANAISAQLSLRSISIFGCAMAAVWAFSPVGGQASLRIMTVASTSVMNATSFDYIPAANSYYDWHRADGSYLESFGTGLYVAALLTPARIKDSPMDLWSNVKVPMLEDLPGWKGEAGTASSWLDVPAENVTYTSLVGIPVSGVNASSGATSFRIETSYWRLQCSTVQVGRTCAQFEPRSTPARCPVRGGIDWNGASGMASLLLSNSSDTLSETEGPICNRSANATNVLPRNLTYSAWTMTNDQIRSTDEPFNARCTIETSWVELDIQCQARECSVKRMRRSQRPHPPSGWTSLDDFDCSNWTYFSIWFVSVADASTSGSGALPQGYLSDPSDPTLAKYTNDTVTWPWDLRPDVFAQRLCQLLNTWWMVSIDREALLSGVDSVRSGRVDVGSSTTETNKLQVDTANGTLTQEFPIVRCRQSWFVALLVASVVLLVASVVPPVVRFWARAPAFGLLVSTMLRDNPYFGAPEAGSTLDSSERSRLLQQRVVRFGDVAPGDTVGHLAIGSIGGSNEGDGAVCRIRKGRLYK